MERLLASICRTLGCVTLVLMALIYVSHAQSPITTDARNIKTGFVIPDEGYSDQPYVVITDDGAGLRRGIDHRFGHQTEKCRTER